MVTLFSDNSYDEDASSEMNNRLGKIYFRSLHVIVVFPVVLCHNPVVFFKLSKLLKLHDACTQHDSHRHSF